MSYNGNNLQVAETSYDFVEDDNDPSNVNPYHGTACGGVLGALKDDETCGVGIAHEVNLGGESTHNSCGPWDLFLSMRLS